MMTSSDKDAKPLQPAGPKPETTPARPDAGAERTARSRHIDALLDAALEGTFPASDPVSLSRDG
jgi:hypothetical protein